MEIALLAIYLIYLFPLIFNLFFRALLITFDNCTYYEHKYNRLRPIVLIIIYINFHFEKFFKTRLKAAIIQRVEQIYRKTT